MPEATEMRSIGEMEVSDFSSAIRSRIAVRNS